MQFPQQNHLTQLPQTQADLEAILKENSQAEHVAEDVIELFRFQFTNDTLQQIIGLLNQRTSLKKLLIRECTLTSEQINWFFNNFSNPNAISVHIEHNGLSAIDSQALYQFFKNTPSLYEFTLNEPNLPEHIRVDTQYFLSFKMNLIFGSGLCTTKEFRNLDDQGILLQEMVELFNIILNIKVNPTLIQKLNIGSCYNNARQRLIDSEQKAISPGHKRLIDTLLLWYETLIVEEDIEFIKAYFTSCCIFFRIQSRLSYFSKSHRLTLLAQSTLESFFEQDEAKVLVLSLGNSLVQIIGSHFRHKTIKACHKDFIVGMCYFLSNNVYSLDQEITQPINGLTDLGFFNYSGPDQKLLEFEYLEAKISVIPDFCEHDQVESLRVLLETIKSELDKTSDIVLKLDLLKKISLLIDDYIKQINSLAKLKRLTPSAQSILDIYQQLCSNFNNVNLNTLIKEMNNQQNPVVNAIRWAYFLSDSPIHDTKNPKVLSEFIVHISKMTWPFLQIKNWQLAKTSRSKHEHDALLTYLKYPSSSIRIDNTNLELMIKRLEQYIPSLSYLIRELQIRGSLTRFELEWLRKAIRIKFKLSQNLLYYISLYENAISKKLSLGPQEIEKELEKIKTQNKPSGLKMFKESQLEETVNSLRLCNPNGPDVLYLKQSLCVFPNEELELQILNPKFETLILDIATISEAQLQLLIDVLNKRQNRFELILKTVPSTPVLFERLSSSLLFAIHIYYSNASPLNAQHYLRLLERNPGIEQIDCYTTTPDDALNLEGELLLKNALFFRQSLWNSIGTDFGEHMSNYQHSLNLKIASLIHAAFLCIIKRESEQFALHYNRAMALIGPLKKEAIKLDKIQMLLSHIESLLLSLCIQGKSAPSLFEGCRNSFILAVNNLQNYYITHDKVCDRLNSLPKQGLIVIDSFTPTIDRLSEQLHNISMMDDYQRTFSYDNRILHLNMLCFLVSISALYQKGALAYRYPTPYHYMESFLGQLKEHNITSCHGIYEPGIIGGLIQYILSIEKDMANDTIRLSDPLNSIVQTLTLIHKLLKSSNNTRLKILATICMFAKIAPVIKRLEVKHSPKFQHNALRLIILITNLTKTDNLETASTLFNSQQSPINQLLISVAELLYIKDRYEDLEHKLLKPKTAGQNNKAQMLAEYKKSSKVVQFILKLNLSVIMPNSFTQERIGLELCADSNGVLLISPAELQLALHLSVKQIFDIHLKIISQLVDYKRQEQSKNIDAVCYELDPLFEEALQILQESEKIHQKNQLPLTKDAEISKADYQFKTPGLEDTHQNLLKWKSVIESTATDIKSRELEAEKNAQLLIDSEVVKKKAKPKKPKASKPYQPSEAPKPQLPQEIPCEEQLPDNQENDTPIENLGDSELETAPVKSNKKKKTKVPVKPKKKKPVKKKPTESKKAKESIKPNIPIQPKEIAVPPVPNELTIEEIPISKPIISIKTLSGKKIEVSPVITEVMNSFANKGLSPYLFGGKLCNLLLDIEDQSDADIRIFGDEKEALSILTELYNAQPIIHFPGLYHFIYKGQEFDITYTSEPENHEFTRGADCSANTLSMNHKGQIFDPLKILKRLKEGTTRILKENLELSLPDGSTKENFVILLRNVRIPIQRNLKLDNDSQQFIKTHVEKIRKIPLGIIISELTKVINSGLTTEIFNMYLTMGIFEVFFPKLTPQNMKYNKPKIIEYAEACDKKIIDSKHEKTPVLFNEFLIHFVRFFIPPNFQAINKWFFSSITWLADGKHGDILLKHINEERFLEAEQKLIEHRLLKYSMFKAKQEQLAIEDADQQLQPIKE